MHAGEEWVSGPLGGTGLGHTRESEGWEMAGLYGQGILIGLHVRVPAVLASSLHFHGCPARVQNPPVPHFTMCDLEEGRKSTKVTFRCHYEGTANHCIAMSFCSQLVAVALKQS